MNELEIDRQHFRPSDTISVWTGVYWHKGVYVGFGYVISASREHGRVVIQSVSRFGKGR